MRVASRESDRPVGMRRVHRGHLSDWRLPNVKEFLSLIDFSESAPALVATHPFLNVFTAGVYWPVRDAP